MTDLETLQAMFHRVGFEPQLNDMDSKDPEGCLLTLESKHDSDMKHGYWGTQIKFSFDRDGNLTGVTAWEL